MPRAEAEPGKERRKKPLTRESLSIRALALPDNTDPTIRKYLRDEDVAKEVYADKLTGLKGKRLETELAISVGEIEVARRKFIDSILFPMARPDGNVPATNDALAIKAMYPDQVLSTQDIIELINRPKKPSRTNANARPATEVIGKPFNLLNHIEEVEKELRQPPMGHLPVDKPDLYYEALPGKLEK
jgi:hypothetical protein